MRQSAHLIFNRTPVMVKESLSRDQFRLYQLIWKRFYGKQNGAGGLRDNERKDRSRRIPVYSVCIEIAFDGFMSVYTSDDDEKQRIMFW